MRLSQNTPLCVPAFMVMKEMSPSATVQLTNVLLIGFGQQWSSMEQRKEVSQVEMPI